MITHLVSFRQRRKMIMCPILCIWDYLWANLAKSKGRNKWINDINLSQIVSRKWVIIILLEGCLTNSFRLGMKKEGLQLGKWSLEDNFAQVLPQYFSSGILWYRINKCYTPNFFIWCNLQPKGKTVKKNFQLLSKTEI